MSLKLLIFTASKTNNLSIIIKISNYFLTYDKRNYGETETKLKDFFEKTANSSPCVVFIDDFESICTRKEMLNQENEKRILTLFTSLLDQSQNVLYLCLTNKIDNIDLSLRRPGRLDKEIEIPIPVQSARYSVSLICQKKKI